MPDTRGEIVGFLCRWCLLALAGLIAVLAAWAGVAATKAVADELATTVILPDGVWGADKSGRPHLRGCFSTPLPRHNPAILMSVQAGRIETLIGAKEMFFVSVLHAGQGANLLEVRGTPYGPFAFQTAAATCLMPAPGREVLLLDARMVAPALQANPDLLRQCLAELRRRGDVVLFHPGPPEAFVQQRSLAIQAKLNLPALCTIKDTHHPMQTLWDTAWFLNGRATVITNDPELARLAASDGQGRFDVHLVSSDAEAQPPERLKQHRSLVKFKEYLLGQPIPE